MHVGDGLVTRIGLVIKGLVWFGINKETDWRISSSPETEAAIIGMAADPYFNPN
jgi:hypothetical protein